MVKVSVVIPVYNVEEFLGECLDSICNQTLEDIEIICVNDGSKDRSLEILNEYASRDERITVIDQENGGHAVATNRGMKLAKGEYLFLMDSDDILDLKALEESYKVAEEKQVDFVIFQAINYYMDTGELVEAENYSMNGLYDIVGDSIFNYKDVKDYVFNITVTPWSKLYRRDFIEKNSITFPEGLVFDDNVFFYDVLFAADKITFLKKHLFKRRWYSQSSTRSGARHFKDYIQICELIWQVFAKYGVFYEFEKELYHKKVSTVYYWYKNINEEFKQEFFDEMKEDYLRIAADDEFCKNFYKKITKSNRQIFTNVLKADTYKEFNLLMEIDDLKKENKKLKNQIKEFESSNSWKITRPLRSLKK